MRKADREVTEFDKLIGIIEKCDVCRLALNDESGYPYLLALNFGVKVIVGKAVLYFHSALEGSKLDIIRRDNRAAFEMDCEHVLQSFADKGYCTMSYSSVVGRGRITFVDDEKEKLEGLTVMTDHYHKKHFAFNPASIPRTIVYKLEIETMTGKKKAKK